MVCLYRRGEVGVEPDFRVPVHQRAEPDIFEPAKRRTPMGSGFCLRLREAALALRQNFGQPPP